MEGETHTHTQTHTHTGGQRQRQTDGEVDKHRPRETEKHSLRETTVKQMMKLEVQCKFHYFGGTQNLQVGKACQQNVGGDGAILHRHLEGANVVHRLTDTDYGNGSWSHSELVTTGI